MAGNGASTMLELALSYDRVDPNLPDNEGNTPLHFAAQAGKWRFKKEKEKKKKEGRKSADEYIIWTVYFESGVSPF